MRPIERVGVMSLDELRQQYEVKRTPVILTGAQQEWRALRSWTPEFLRERAGHREVRALLDLPTVGVTLPGTQAKYERSMRFPEFVDRMLSTTNAAPCYVAYLRARDLLPELEADFDFLKLTGGREGDGDTRLWIGSGGTRSMLHADLKDNFFAQLYGRKRVMLVPKDEFRLVYPFPGNLVNSRVDPDAPDFSAYPRYREATVFAGVMGPGDLLFIPKGWWHHMRGLEPSISLNHWFGAPERAAYYLFQLATLGPMYWRTSVRDFVAHAVLRRPYAVDFFFSPPPTGQRLFDLLAHGDFSRENDPAAEESWSADRGEKRQAVDGQSGTVRQGEQRPS